MQNFYRSNQLIEASIVAEHNPQKQIRLEISLGSGYKNTKQIIISASELDAILDIVRSADAFSVLNKSKEMEIAKTYSEVED